MTRTGLLFKGTGNFDKKKAGRLLMILCGCEIWGFHNGVKIKVFAKLISSTLKMEAICSSETSVETRRTTRRHIPEEDTLQD
jgi:hypothetical protein